MKKWAKNRNQPNQPTNKPTNQQNKKMRKKTNQGKNQKTKNTSNQQNKKWETKKIKMTKCENKKSASYFFFVRFFPNSLCFPV